MWTFSLLNSLLANMFVMCLHQLIYTVLYCTVQGNVQQRPRDGNMDDVNWTYSDIVICKIIYRCFDQACIQISSDIYKIWLGGVGKFLYWEEVNLMEGYWFVVLENIFHLISINWDVAPSTLENYPIAWLKTVSIFTEKFALFQISLLSIWQSDSLKNAGLGGSSAQDGSPAG